MGGEGHRRVVGARVACSGARCAAGRVPCGRVADLVAVTGVPLAPAAAGDALEPRPLSLPAGLSQGAGGDGCGQGPGRPRRRGCAAGGRPPSPMPRHWWARPPPVGGRAPRRTRLPRGPRRRCSGGRWRRGTWRRSVVAATPGVGAPSGGSVGDRRLHHRLYQGGYTARPRGCGQSRAAAAGATAGASPPSPPPPTASLRPRGVPPSTPPSVGPKNGGRLAAHVHTRPPPGAPLPPPTSPIATGGGPGLLQPRRQPQVGVGAQTVSQQRPPA